ncbi:rhodanese-like domain-containing protein [Rhodobaculum claviforme]|uniref:Rhodanese domain-containing protein n=1 Tax=Rhodobaculum claviforme TaxID=1549854 RepID=A0A934WJX1_9RHOB|nr:rhodanese-like domain-containing protein [Rhodobaculum claviforme]MBK5928304.1 hypothetical protein [Rhodobaculum claviforme]
MIDAPVIDPAEAAGPLRLLDVRDAESFAAGHAPGAVRVPVEDWVADARTPAGAFANTTSWADVIAALDIGPGTIAGILDDGRMTEAARVGLPPVWQAQSSVFRRGLRSDVCPASERGRG